MTLDEAIKHAEEVAEENEKSLRGWKECINRGTVGWSDFDKEKVDTSITRCSKCAEEHRQLAEWLKDYKRLKEQEPQIDILDKIRVEIERAADKQIQIAMGVADLNERYTHIQMENAYRHSLNIIDKYRSEG